MWICKLCKFNASSQIFLYRHIKVIHSGGAPSILLPCLFTECPFTFRTLGRLRGHISTNHSGSSSQSNNAKACVKCVKCNKQFYSQNAASFLAHLRKHISQHELIECPFIQCVLTFRNASTFRSHVSRMCRTKLLMKKR